MDGVAGEDELTDPGKRQSGAGGPVKEAELLPAPQSLHSMDLDSWILLLLLGTSSRKTSHNLKQIDPV